MIKTPRKKIFTWHIHGSYLYYLSQGDFDIYIPVNDKKDEGYYGRGLTFPFGPNIIEIDISDVREADFDLILFQTDKNYLVDQYEILSSQQRKLPRIFLKHDPPPPDNKIVVTDQEIMIVHVTWFNKLMWDNNELDSRVIMHGVTDNGHKWNGKKEKGIMAINNMSLRGRVLGLDIFRRTLKEVPVEIVGMGNDDLGGSEVLHPYLTDYISDYRFYFNPVRYSSFPLAVCEAMMTGMPVVALATTELPTVIKDGINGFIHTDPEYLISKMKMLINDYETAALIGKNARKTAEETFGIKRFINDWNTVFEEVICTKTVDQTSY
jgi:glycosyltransferase involved in cell wall biosynthesis